MSKLFIFHSSQDDGFVRGLQQALGDLGQEVWIDSRALRGGDLLWPEIRKAIEEASAYTVVVSTDGLQSKWVGKELRHALDVQKQRGKGKFPVIPLSLDDTKLGVLEEFFGEEPVYLHFREQRRGRDRRGAERDPRRNGQTAPCGCPRRCAAEGRAAGRARPRDHRPEVPRAGQRPSRLARARLVYEPATPGQPHVHSAQRWRFVAPLGPIEVEELRWYLEKYAIWPSEYFRDRARKVELSLVESGRRLYEAALPIAHTENVLQAWARVPENAGRRFSVHVDASLEAGAPTAEQETAREAATVLLGLPWELVHDSRAFLFQGAKPTRVRRRLPNIEPRDVSVVATPIRILLATARPEDDAGGYIDHRASALPLVKAMEDLGGLVLIHVAQPAHAACTCAKSSTAPAAPASRITSSTSMATASMIARSASAGCASRTRRTPASSTSAGTPPSSPVTLVRCCAITASRSSSSKPARPRRPRRRPDPSPPNC